jgi:hypothetical protein
MERLKFVLLLYFTSGVSLITVTFCLLVLCLERNDPRWHALMDGFSCWAKTPVILAPRSFLSTFSSECYSSQICAFSG